MEYDGLCFHFSVFDVHFVTTQYDGNGVTDAHQITVPVGDIFVGDTGIHVKHNDGTLT